MPRIAFSTLGCKINQFDTAAMQSSVTSGNDYSIVSFDDEADIYVINTCTVTGKSDSESRRIIRRALRKNRNARVIVTGCYAQTNPAEIAKIHGVSMILGNNEKLTLKHYLKDSEELVADMDNNIHVSDVFETSSIQKSVISEFQAKTRAILKIQDGCDSRCSYCIVPFARGISRSLNPDDVITQIKSLCSNGYKEVVLSGVHLGGYGRDLPSRLSLSDVIRMILSETDIQRIRLSSIEPREVTDELIELTTEEERICNHFHMPLQSGDDYILDRMNRNYDAAFYKALICKIKDKIKDAGIGCDVIVGYPGEEERHFINTYRLIEKLPITYLHVFAYSPRKGTAAYNINDTVKGDVKAHRSELIRNLGAEKNLAFKTAHIGKVVDVLVEDERDEVTGLLKGYTGNYLRVLINENVIPAKFVPARYKRGAGIQNQAIVLDSRVRGNDNIKNIISVQITGIMNGSLSGKLFG